MPIQGRVRSVAVMILASTALASTAAYADGASARDAYRQGKSAYDAGDFGRAARAFADADARSPNDAVLELAVAATARADDPVLGMDLVARAESRGMTGAARAGRRLFEKRAGRAVLACPESVRCVATMDGATMRAGKATWASVGKHDVALDVDGVVQHVVVTIDAGATNEIRPPPRVERALVVTQDQAPRPSTDPSSAREPSRPRRPSAAWFWGGAAATAVLGTVAVGSGMNAVYLHDRFEADRTDAGLAERGTSAQLRTNVLLVGTAVAALATATIGYIVFHRRGERNYASR